MGSGPVAAVTPAPVVCGAGAGYQLRRRDAMLASRCQQKTHTDVYYRGVVVQPAGQYAQGTGFNTGTMHFLFHLKLNGYERIYKDMKGCLSVNRDVQKLGKFRDIQNTT